MKLPIVTISREFGSHGREIGEKVAKILGVEFYDKKIIEEAAKESGLQPEIIEQNEQKNQYRFLNYMPMTSCYMWEPTLMDKIYIAEHRVITRLAEKGPCVIVGRVADFILSDRNDVMNVFIYADPEVRVQNVVKDLGLDPVKAKREIRVIDNHRAMYYNAISSKDWGARSNYHLLINSGTFGDDLCAEVIHQAALNFEQTQKE